MTSFFKPLLIAAMLAGAGLATGAHAMGMGMGGHHGDGQRGQHQRMDPARMQQMMAQRQAVLKARLKITASQEASWNAYVASMQPPAGMGQRIAHKMNPASLPGGAEHFGDGSFYAFMGIGDHQLHAAQTATGKAA